MSRGRVDEYMARVGVAKRDERYETVARALELIKPDIDSGRIKGRRVLVKPNLVSNQVELAVVHVDAVRAVIDFMRGFNARRIIVAESSTGDTQEAFRRFGYGQLESRYSDVRLMDLNRDSHDAIRFETVDGAGRSVKVSRTVKECDFRVSLARAKTHDHLVCTLTLKNMLGCVHKTEQVWAHGDAPEPSEPLNRVLKSNWLLAKNLVRLASIVKPDLGVIDGFVGMEGDGPISGTPVELHSAVASPDFVGADAVMASTMGFDPAEISYIHLATKLGLGNGELKSLKTLGDDPKALRRAFKPHSNYSRTQTRWREYADADRQSTA